MEAEIGGPPRLTVEELEAVAKACQSFLFPIRFLNYFRGSLVQHLQNVHPALARKLSHLSDREFARLYEQVNGRSKESPE